MSNFVKGLYYIKLDLGLSMIAKDSRGGMIFKVGYAQFTYSKDTDPGEMLFLQIWANQMKALT